MTDAPRSSAPAGQTGRPTLRIDRCVCMNRRFADLLPEARARRSSLTQLIGDTGCGGQCGLCHPYLRRMLSTGETVFHQIIEPGAE